MKIIWGFSLIFTLFFCSTSSLKSQDNWENALKEWLYLEHTATPPKKLLTMLNKITWEDISISAKTGLNDKGSGLWRLTLTLLDSSTYHVFVTVPKDYNNNIAKAATVYLHGTHVTNDLKDKLKNTNSSQDEQHWPDRSPEEGRILIQPMANGNTHHWGPSRLGQQLVIQALKLAQMHWNIDPDKITLYGISAGANGAFRISMTEPRLFSNISMDYLGSLQLMDREKIWNLRSTPTFIHLSGDSLHPVEFMKENITALEKIGAPVNFGNENNALRIRWPNPMHLVCTDTSEYRRNWLEVLSVDGPQLKYNIHSFSGNQLIETRMILADHVHLSASFKNNIVDISATAIHRPLPEHLKGKVKEKKTILKKIRLWIPNEWKAGKKLSLIFNKTLKKSISPTTNLKTCLTALKHDPTRPCSRYVDVSINKTLPWEKPIKYKGFSGHYLVYTKQNGEDMPDAEWEDLARGLEVKKDNHNAEVQLQITPPPPENMPLVVKAESDHFNIKLLTQIKNGFVTLRNLSPGQYTFTITAKQQEINLFKPYFPWIVANPKAENEWSTQSSSLKKVSDGKQIIKLTLKQ